MQKRMNKLYEDIKQYNDSYYLQNISLIDDYEFDQLLKELKELEAKYPEYKIANSPTEVVGGGVDRRFEKQAHKHPMLSLDNVFSAEEFYEFDKRVRKELGHSNYTYVCELKIDGLAMSLTYDNTLSYGLTRGDGQVGENVTHNVLTISSLPKTIDYTDFEVRGEVFIDKNEFERINQVESKIYANPRNLAAGTIRQLDASVTKNRRLDMFVYGLVDPQKYGFSTYFDSMNFLKDLGFKTNEYMRLCPSALDVVKYIEEITIKRDLLDYEIDGLVIKVNEYENQTTLGFTSKYPKWATAYKFKSDHAQTKLEDIFLTVGRTGKITPNAMLTPVQLMGSVIARATLHNLNYIHEKDIRVGDKVVVIKAGDVIPRVEGFVEQSRSDQEVYEMPTNCPACDSVLELIDADHFCLNQQCSGRHFENLSHFVSRNAMNIDGLGPKIIEKLIELKLINNYVDIYRLDAEQLAQVEGFKEKSINNTLESITQSKNASPANFLFALGIKHVGLTVAKVLVKEIDNFEQLYTMTEDEFSAIDGIGQVIAKSLVDYFEQEVNLTNINEVRELGVDLTIVKQTIDTTSIYSGKTIVITGSFSEYKRNDIKEKLESVDAKVSSSVSKATDYLFAGEKAGSKMTKAQELNITIIEEDKINQFMKGEEWKNRFLY